jgi:prevent-host-death family protein
MITVNMLDAKTNLSRLVEAVESGAEAEIIIARNGKPAARLVPIAPPAAGPRIGVAKGQFETPLPDPALEAEAAALFNAEPR